MDVVSPATVNSQLSQGKEEYKKRQRKARHTNLETGRNTAEKKILLARSSVVKPSSPFF